MAEAGGLNGRADGTPSDPPLIPIDTLPDAVVTLIELASDVDGRTRANAFTLAESGIDTQELRDLMAARLTDEYQDAT
ncbi:hypothetical protein [Micromonospora chersina]|uniref:hypothetical protein n=1 Tax=Micromonospora chersina TaxID=47854 RepID=UPI0033A58AEB